MDFKPFTSVRIDEHVQISWSIRRAWSIEIALQALSEQQDLDWRTAVALDRGLALSDNRFRYVDLVLATPGELGAEGMAKYDKSDADFAYTWYEKICDAALANGLELLDARVVLSYVLERGCEALPKDDRWRRCYFPAMKPVQWGGRPSVFEIDNDEKDEKFVLSLSGRFLNSMSDHGHWKMDEQIIFVKPRAGVTDKCR